MRYRTYRSGRFRPPLALTGKSGSGKTTLLNCLGGLEKPDQGRITLFDHDITAIGNNKLSRLQRREMGFLFQAGNLLSFLNAYENIALPLRLNNITGTRQKKRIQFLLDYIGLSSMGKAMPNELSGGEQQRIAFARAIVHSPRLLLADEPAASLDTETGKTLISLMFTLAETHGILLVISTHDPEIIQMSPKAIVLRNGRMHERR